MESIKFTKAELIHLLTLLEVNDEDGWYSGNRMYWQKRSEKIQLRLNKILSNERETVRKHEQLQEFCSCKLPQTTFDNDKICTTCHKIINWERNE